jgi:hypothetical protein
MTSSSSPERRGPRRNFHTFNTLHDSGKQIVVDERQIPEGYPKFRDSGHVSRGLIADIQPPEIETKIAISGQRRRRAISSCRTTSATILPPVGLQHPGVGLFGLPPTVADQPQIDLILSRPSWKLLRHEDKRDYNQEIIKACLLN